RIFDSLTGPSDPELIRQMQVGYYACITHLDHQIGRLIMGLIEHEVYNDTVILFTSDHGEELGDHHYFRKSLPYEGSSHIPMILSGNAAMGGFKPGSVCHEVVELRDVMPTILEIAGAKVPDTVDGISMLAIADEAAQERPERVYLHGEHSYSGLSNHWIVTKTDKYCWFSETGQEQYFDLAEDPHELHDLINEPSKQPRIEELRKVLMQELLNRPEGFTDGTKLIPGRPYPTYLSI
ncbi:MAG: sulfatase-like hydrolase/transferase, partial [Firmicutes bacterium]|nr:sulfatase-like hydrolase/transferase [Bacillota bacterium]